MARLSKFDKDQIINMFRDDFNTINMGIKQQLIDQWEKTKKEILAERNAVDNRNKVKRVEEKLESLEEEYHAFMTSYQSRKATFEGEKALLEKETMGLLGTAPEPKQLLSLGINADRYHHRDKEWFGVEIKTQLDAMVAIRIRTQVDLGNVMDMFKQVQDAVWRDVRFAEDSQTLKDLYDRFRSLGFDKFGIKLPPRLSDVESKPEFKALQTPKKGARQTDEGRKLLKASKSVVKKKDKAAA